MILKEKMAIPPEMTASQLHDRLSAMGAKLIMQTLEMLEQGTAPRTPQTEENTCYASMITKEDCRIDFTKSADTIYNQIRGLSASPCAFTFLEGKRLKVYFAEKVQLNAEAPAGTVIGGDVLCVACGEGALRLTDIQLEGGKRMTDSDFLRGRKVPAGTFLG